MRTVVILCFVEFLFESFAMKTEIKFSLNVKSLFRCKRNGPVFSFDSFPSDELFQSTVINSTKGCELVLSTIDRRVIFDLKELYLQCELKWFDAKYLNEIVVFRSNCSVDEKHDRCARHTPTNVLIITDILTKTKEILTIRSEIFGIGTEDIEIGDRAMYPYPYDRYRTRGAKSVYLVFMNRFDEYLKMMCRYTFVNEPDGSEKICKWPKVFFKHTSQRRSGPATPAGRGWSWVCYYYPADAEDPVDYRMIEKAQKDVEKTKPKQLVPLNSGEITELSELRKDEKNGSSSAILILLIIAIVASGLFCIYKNKCQVKSKRSSMDSEESGTSSESLEK